MKITNPISISFRPGQFNSYLSLSSLDAITQEITIDIIPVDTTTSFSLSGQFDTPAFQKLIDAAEDLSKKEISKISLLIDSSHLILLKDKEGDSEEFEPVGIVKNKPDALYPLYAKKSSLIAMIQNINRNGIQVSALQADPAAFVHLHKDSVFERSLTPFVEIDDSATTCMVLTGDTGNAFYKNHLGFAHFVKDLMSGLQLSEAQAIRTLLTRGFKSELYTRLDESDTCTWRDVMGILVPRARELAVHIAKQLIAYKGQLKNGIVVGGLGSGIPGLNDFLSEQLKIPVRSYSEDMRSHMPNLTVRVHAAHLLSTADPYSLFYGGICAGFLDATAVRDQAKNKVSFLKASFRDLVEWFKDLT